MDTVNFPTSRSGNQTRYKSITLALDNFLSQFYKNTLHKTPSISVLPMIWIGIRRKSRRAVIRVLCQDLDRGERRDATDQRSIPIWSPPVGVDVLGVG